MHAILSFTGGNRSMLAHVGVTKEKPYFEVDAVRLFCLWDPPHLWVHTGWWYIYDSKQDIRLCCRLTTKHVHLPPFASMRVRFATQVLSHSIAVDIKTLAQIKLLTDQVQRNFMAATKFCENFDGIFNCFNSKQLKDSHKLKSAISDGSTHFPILWKVYGVAPPPEACKRSPLNQADPMCRGVVAQHCVLENDLVWSSWTSPFDKSPESRLPWECLLNH